MTITSLVFVAFVLFVLTVYYVLPLRAQNVWLLGASYLFCITWARSFAAILLAVTLLNYWIGLRLGKQHVNRRRWLWLGIGVNLAALLGYRYADFYVPELVTLLRGFGFAPDSNLVEILLPLGLSFYALQGISYLVDVSRGQLEPEADPVVFALYMAYFCKLVAGPIERARTLLPLLAAARRVDNELLSRSLTLILIGTVRKVVIANSLHAMIPADAFVPGHAYGLTAIMWLVAYYFFLYNDFAGYTSIVRGVSGLFGIELSLNFAEPFFARSFAEYWTRWNITLSNWLRDYIFFPLSRALLRRNPTPRNVPNLILPPILTMLASGIWHGGSLNMLLWGGIHGTYLMAERIPAFWRPHVPVQNLPAWRQLLSMLVVFGLTLIAIVPFIMDVPAAIAYWKQMAQVTAAFQPDWRILLLAVPSLGLDWTAYYFRDELVWLRLPRVPQAALLALAVLLVFWVTQSDTGAPFVYAGF